jgi:methionyl-tRNA formyltransferase
MRVVFMGTGNFAVPALQAVISSSRGMGDFPHSEAELVCVITQPDRPKGRRLRTVPSPVKEIALEHHLLLYQPEKVRERGFVEILQSLKPDLIVVAAFGQILPKSILDLSPLGCVNLHPSLLPKFRGAAPIQRAIMNGEKETGVTVMFMDEGEDTGDIILQEKMAIEISDSAELLSQKLAGLAARLIRQTLQLAKDGTIPRQPQDHSKASYASKLKKEDGLINWKKSALEIHNLIRGTIPWPGAYTAFGETEGTRRAVSLRIWESQLRVGMPALAGAPGTITDILPDAGIVVATGDMDLLITSVQPASKSRMTARDFVNGYRVKVGDTFQNLKSQT